MSLTPIGARILVLPDEPDAEPDSLIVLPDAIKDDRVDMSGTVSLKGPGPRCEECHGHLRSDLEVGDRVVFAPNVGSEVVYDGVRYVVLAEDDILGVLEEDE